MPIDQALGPPLPWSSATQRGYTCVNKQTGMVLNLGLTSSQPSHSWHLSAKWKHNECFSRVFDWKDVKRLIFVTQCIHKYTGPAEAVIKTRMGLVCERLQHQRKSVHVEVPHVFRRHLLPACNWPGVGCIYNLYENYCIQCYSQRFKKCKRVPNDMNASWIIYEAIFWLLAWPLLFCFRQPWYMYITHTDMSDWISLCAYCCAQGNNDLWQQQSAHTLCCLAAAKICIINVSNIQ